jgi:hypothetical protein
MRLLTPAVLLSLAPAALGQYINPAIGRLYRFTPVASSWSDAEAQAEAMGATLSAITGPHELSWILNNVPLPPNTYLWLGGRDHAIGDWTWVSGDAFFYTNWRAGEPNGNPAIGESYIAMTTSPPDTGTWADFYNTDGPFIGLVESCYANCDGSTAPPILNVNDFTCFLAAFAGGSTYANCDSSTTPPILNVNDFVCFMGYFVDGCQ